ncbi:MAG: hypothetical protein KAT90_10385 [Gammaproteobacteria bacterium]|nr:hypothetical protein [Gammaproteobacteria bacterium]
MMDNKVYNGFANSGLQGKTVVSGCSLSNKLLGKRALCFYCFVGKNNLPSPVGRHLDKREVLSTDSH